MWAELKRKELGVHEVTIANTKIAAGMDRGTMTSHLSVMFRDVTQCRDEITLSFIKDPLVFDHGITNFALFMLILTIFAKFGN